MLCRLRGYLINFQSQTTLSDLDAWDYDAVRGLTRSVVVWRTGRLAHDLRFVPQDIDVRMNYRIDSVLCLVDAKNILTQLARVPKEGAVNEAVQQLAFADSVIINKTDLVDEAHLKVVKEKISSVNAFAKVVRAEKVQTWRFFVGWQRV